MQAITNKAFPPNAFWNAYLMKRTAITLIHALLMLLVLGAMLTSMDVDAGMSVYRGSDQHRPTKVKKAGGDYNNAVYEEEIVDLEVKVLGGMVKHTRYLSGGVTQFNPNWASLVLEFSEEKEAFLPETLKRNRHKYARQGETETWVYDERNYITKTENGYRWYNREGDWVDYDNEGVTLGYGDRNNIGVTFTRDARGHIEKVLDHFNTPVLTFYYYADTGWLEKAVDYTGRQVSYEYVAAAGSAVPDTSSRGVIYGGRLTKIKDVAGQDWVYGYSVSPYFLLTSKTGPDGQVINIGYGGLSDGQGGVTIAKDTAVCTNWVAESWEQGNDGNWQARMKCLASSSAGGPIYVEADSGEEGPTVQLNPEDRVDPVIQSVSVNNEQLRRYIYLYNKDKKIWVRGVQDGDGGLIVTHINEQGELLELIRNGRSVEKQGNL